MFTLDCPRSRLTLVAFHGLREKIDVAGVHSDGDAGIKAFCNQAEGKR